MRVLLPAGVNNEIHFSFSLHMAYLNWLKMRHWLSHEFEWENRRGAL